MINTSPTSKLSVIIDDGFVDWGCILFEQWFSSDDNGKICSSPLMYHWHPSEKYVKLLTSADVSVELVGSWSVIVGDQDQAFHIWRYIGGYAEIDKARRTLTTTPVSKLYL